MADDRISVPVDTSLVILAGLVGIAIGVGVALLWAWFNPQTVPVQAAPAATLQVLRDEKGRILQLTEGT